MKNNLCIVIPTFNEINNIETLIKRIKANTKDIKILVLFVDDNSPDNTSQEITRVSNKYNSNNFKISLIKRKNKQGLGTAYIEGFQKVIDMNKFSHVLQMDADLSHNPKYIKNFIRVMDGKSLIIGSRYIKKGSTPDWSLQRRIISKFGNLYLKIMLSSSISDYTTGYNLIKIDILKKINLKKINSRGYSFLAELKYKIYKIDNNVVEIPITFNDRKFGKSKLPKSTIPATLILPFKLKNNK